MAPPDRLRAGGHARSPRQVERVGVGDDRVAEGVAHAPVLESQVADRFHVVQLATRQLDRVRAAEAKESKEKRALLARTKYIWLKNEANLTEGQAERRRSLAGEH